MHMFEFLLLEHAGYLKIIFFTVCALIFRVEKSVDAHPGFELTNLGLEVLHYYSSIMVATVYIYKVFTNHFFSALYFAA